MLLIIGRSPVRSSRSVFGQVTRPSQAPASGHSSRVTLVSLYVPEPGGTWAAGLSPSARLPGKAADCPAGQSRNARLREFRTQRRRNLGTKANKIAGDAVKAPGHGLDVPLPFLPLLLVIPLLLAEGRHHRVDDPADGITAGGEAAGGDVVVHLAGRVVPGRKRLLAKHGYPPDAQPTAPELVLRQMENFAEEWSPRAS